MTRLIPVTPSYIIDGISGMDPSAINFLLELLSANFWRYNKSQMLTIQIGPDSKFGSRIVLPFEEGFDTFNYCKSQLNGLLRVYNVKPLCLDLYLRCRFILFTTLRNRASHRVCRVSWRILSPKEEVLFWHHIVPQRVIVWVEPQPKHKQAVHSFFIKTVK